MTTPDPKKDPRISIREWLLEPDYKSSLGRKQIDIPDCVFSGTITGVILNLEDIRRRGFDMVYTNTYAYTDEFGEARVSAETTYCRDRPETDEEWSARVEKANRFWEERRDTRSDRDRALAKLTREEIEALRKLGI
jgi:hypothetical protein